MWGVQQEMETYSVVSVTGNTVKVKVSRRIYDSKYKMFYYKTYTKLCHSSIAVRVNDLVLVKYGRKISNRKSGVITAVVT